MANSHRAHFYMETSQQHQFSRFLSLSFHTIVEANEPEDCEKYSLMCTVGETLSGSQERHVAHPISPLFMNKND